MPELPDTVISVLQEIRDILKEARCLLRCLLSYDKGRAKSLNEVQE
jgi:hypothetical protein